MKNKSFSKVRSRILSLFLAVCLVFGMIPAIPAAAEEGKIYHVGGEALSLTENVTASTGEWTWDYASRTLTFSKNYKNPTGIQADSANLTSQETYKMLAAALPAGTTIVVNGGVSAELTSYYGDALYCEGNLTVIGNGALALYGSNLGDIQTKVESTAGNPLTEPYYEGDDNKTGSGLVCKGKLTVGDASTTPYMYIYSKGYTDHVMELNSAETSEIVNGYVSIAAHPAPANAKICSNTAGAALAVSGKAALHYPARDESSVDVTFAKEDAAAGYYFGTNGTYHPVIYNKNTENGGKGDEVPTKQSVMMLEGEKADLTVTAIPVDGYIFCGWGDDASDTEILTEMTVTTTINLYAIYKTRETTPNASINYKENVISGLEAGATYKITIGNGAEQTVVLGAGETTYALDTVANAGATVKVVKAGSGNKVDSEAQELTVAAKGAAPATSNFNITQATNGSEIGTITASGSDTLTATYEYSEDGISWHSGDGVKLSKNVKDAAATYYIRYAATETAPASEAVEVTLNKALVKENKPNATINYKESQLEGLEAGSYTITLNENQVKNVTVGTDGICEIKNLDEYDKIWVVKKGDNTNTCDSDKQILTVTDKAAAPAEGNFAVKQAEGEETQATVSGITSSYEYSLDNGTTWHQGTGADVKVDAGSRISIRVPATETTPASNALVLTMDAAQGQEDTPEAEINYVTSQLENLKPNAQYDVTIGTGEKQTFTADGTGAIAIENISSYAGQTISVVKKGVESANTYDSAAQSLEVEAKAEKPAENTFTVTEADGGLENATVSGITADYEYSLDGGESWNNGTGASVPVKAGESILIRVPATEDAPESEVLEITTKKPEDEPEATMNYVASQLENLDAEATYLVTIGDGEPQSMEADGDGNIQIENLASYGGETISIVKKGNGTTTCDSAAQELSVAQKATLSADTFTVTEAATGETEATVSGITSDYMYSLDNGATWEQGDGEDVKVPVGTSIKIYKAATEDAPASNELTLNMTQGKAETPEAVINYAESALTGLKPGASYVVSVDGDVIAEETVDESCKIVIENLASYGGKTLSIVDKGSATVGASDALELLVATQENLSEDTFEITEPKAGDTEAVVSGITSEYEYSLNGGTTWTDGDGNPVKVPVGTDIIIRKKETATTPASDELTLSMPKGTEVTPNAVIDYNDSVLTGLVAGAEYVVTVDGTVVAEGAANADAKLAVANISSYAGKNLNIVKKGTATTNDSAAQVLAVATKPTAPSANAFNVTTAIGATSSTVTGITSEYQYSLDDGATWTDGNGQPVSVPAGTDILIRKKATDTTPESEALKLTTSMPVVLVQEAIPNAVVDYQTETLKGLVPGAAYEIIVDGKAVAVTADAAGKTPITNYYGKTIAIVKKGNGTSTSDSTAQTLTVATQVTQPTESQFEVAVDENGGNVVIKNVSSNMEYSINNGVTWTSGTGADLTVPIGTTVLIRVKATATTPVSNTVIINTITKLSVASVEQKIFSTNTDKGDVAGSTFGKLRLKATGKSKSMKLTWKKVKNADGYILYGAQCGKKLKKIKTFTGANKTKYTQKKLKAKKYYKYMVVAYKNVNGTPCVIASSKTAHATTTKGAKYGNVKSVKVKKAKVTVKVKKKSKIKASYKLTHKKIRIHIAKFRYESSNKKVATVTKKGVIKGVKKGSATIYVYAQNGVYKTIKVKVK